MLIDGTGPLPGSVPIWVEEVKFLVKIEMEKETATPRFKGAKEVNRKEYRIPGTCCRRGGGLGRGEETEEMEEDDDVTFQVLNFEKPAQNQETGGRQRKKQVWAELELDRQSPIKRLGSENCLPIRLDRQSPPKAETGRDGYFRPKKHGFKGSGSENSSCARLGLSKERKTTRKEDSSSDDDEESKSSSVSSKERDVNEMEAEKGPASDEGERRGSDSSSIDDWLRRKGKDSIPSIQVVKCSIEGQQANKEANKGKKKGGERLTRSNDSTYHRQQEMAFNTDTGEGHQKEKGELPDSRETTTNNQK